MWPAVREGLQEACLKTGGEIDSAYLWGECRSGNAYLFVIVAEDRACGAFACRFEDWATGKKLRSLATWAEKNTIDGWWDQHCDVLQKTMEQGNANAVVGAGRPFGELKGRFNVRTISRLYEWTPV